MARREAEPDRDREEEELSGEPRRYASNTLALLAARGNPHHVTGLGDLARPGLRVALPNPETESIGRPALRVLAAAGTATPGTVLPPAPLTSRPPPAGILLDQFRRRIRTGSGWSTGRRQGLTAR
jgi:hypothetical protein